MVRNAYDTNPKTTFQSRSGSGLAVSNGMNTYELPPRFKKQLAKQQNLDLSAEKKSENLPVSNSSSPQAFRRKTGRSPLQFEDFLPLEHRRSATSTPDSAKTKTTGATGEATDSTDLPKFERPPRFQKTGNPASVEMPQLPAKKIHKFHRNLRPQRNGHLNGFLPAGPIPVFLPGAGNPANFFAGSPAVQFFPHQVPLIYAGAVPGMEYYPPLAEPILMPPGLTLAEQNQHLAAVYGFAPPMEFYDPGPPPGLTMAGVPIPPQPPKNIPLKATENFVYQPPQESEKKEEEFRFPNHRNREINATDGSNADKELMDFSWEKFCEQISTNVTVEGSNDDSGIAGADESRSPFDDSSFLAIESVESNTSSTSSLPTTGTNTPEMAESPAPSGAPMEGTPSAPMGESPQAPPGATTPIGAVAPMAVPVFARSPPASELPLPPIDWLSY